MSRRSLTSILAAWLLLFFAIPVSAEQTGSIRIETTGGTVALYKVGQINGQNICLYEEYGGAVLTQTDILSANLAAWLNENVRNGQIKATDVWGDVTFENLEPGLYLIAQPSTPSGQSPFEPFLIVMPWDGYVWEVSVDLELLPQTGESAIPQMWIYGMLLSAAGIGLCLLWRKQVLL